MGRNVPSVTARMEEKFEEWKGFERNLTGGSMEAYRELCARAKNYRAPISEMDEPDITIPLLLAMITQLKRELEEAICRLQNSAFNQEKT